MTTADVMAVPWSDRVLTLSPPGSPEWLEAHKGHLGAHDIASILGVGYQTPLQVWAQFTGKIEREDISHLPWIEDGSDFEPVIVSRFARTTSRKILPSPGLVRHPTCPYIAVTPDRCQIHPETGMVGPLETKAVGFYMRKEWDESIPLKHQIQVQAQMAVMECDWGTVAGLPIGRAIGEPGLLYRDVVLEPVFIAFMLEEVERFWVEHVEADIPPPAMQDDTSVLRRMFKREAPGTVIRLNDIHDGLWQERKRLLEEKKAIEARCEEIAATIQQEMGEAEWAEMPSGGVLRWRVEPRKEYVVKASEPRVLREMGAIK